MTFWGNDIILNFQSHGGLNTVEYLNATGSSTNITYSQYTDTDGHTKLSYSVNMWQSLLVFLSIPRHLWDKAGESALPSGRLFVVGPGVDFTPRVAEISHSQSNTKAC